MANVFTDAATIYANLTATGYDKYLEFALRSEPIFRQLVDKHPVDVTNIGPSITLSLIPYFSSLATTPLTENVDPDATAPPSPTRVTVNLAEYGRTQLTTLKLSTLAFTPPEPAIAQVIGKDMVDSLDKLVQNTLDAATHIIGKNGGTVKTDASGFAFNSVAAGDKLDTTTIRNAVTLLRRRNAPTMDAGGNYVGVIHPDVANDILSDTGWLAPHQYQDTENIYNGEIGKYNGARFVTSPRCTNAANTGPVQVYNTYFLGRQGIVEAMPIQPHVVVGPVVDKLRRFNPLGWHALGGWAIFRPEVIEIAQSSSSVAAL